MKWQEEQRRRIQDAKEAFKMLGVRIITFLTAATDAADAQRHITTMAKKEGKEIERVNGPEGEVCLRLRIWHEQVGIIENTVCLTPANLKESYL